MKKFICSVCGYVHEGDKAPEKCPMCHAPSSKFGESGSIKLTEYAAEHKIGIAKDVAPEVVKGLKENFLAECVEVGMYLAMARQADREGFPEIARAYEKIAYEEAHHASLFAELLGEVVENSTKNNLEMRILAEHGACEGKYYLANKAKEFNLEAIQDTVLEMCKDEARHGKAFEGLLNRYFKK